MGKPGHVPSLQPLCHTLNPAGPCPQFTHEKVSSPGEQACLSDTSQVSDTCPESLVLTDPQNLPSPVRGPGSGDGAPLSLPGDPWVAPQAQAPSSPAAWGVPRIRSLCKTVPLGRKELDRKTVQFFTCRNSGTSLLMAIGHTTSKLTPALKRGPWLVGGDKEGV